MGAVPVPESTIDAVEPIAWNRAAPTRRRPGGSLRLGSGSRQLDGEDTTDAGDVAHSDVAPDGFDASTANRQAEAEPRSVGCALLEGAK